MKAVVLAAGEGKRLRPLTNDRPKPMIFLNGRPLLEYILDELPDEITEIILIIGYCGETIRAHFGDSFNGRHITYIEQKERLGTAHAVLLAKENLREKFFLLNADDIGDKASFERGIDKEFCLFVAEHELPERFGVVEVDDAGMLKTFVEKPKHPTTNLVSTGSMVLSPEILLVEPKQHANGEYYIVDMLAHFIGKRPINVVHQASWITVTFPEDVVKTETLLKEMGK